MASVLNDLAVQIRLSEWHLLRLLLLPLLLRASTTWLAFLVLHVFGLNVLQIVVKCPVAIFLEELLPFRFGLGHVKLDTL